MLVFQPAHQRRVGARHIGEIAHSEIHFGGEVAAQATAQRRQGDGILSSELLQQLALSRFNLSKIGTVHALQGGERPFILFSSVYTKNDPPRYFFDQGTNMLNVAVSRAQDSFLVFGDMSIFKRDNPTPSGLLAKHLFANPANAISTNFSTASR